MVDDQGCVVGNEYESDSEFYKERVLVVRTGTKEIEADATDVEEEDENEYTNDNGTEEEEGIEGY